MIRFNVEVHDAENGEYLKLAVNQLVDKDKVIFLKNEFISYANTKGYTLSIESKELGVENTVSIMNSENGLYCLVINTFEELEVNNTTVLDNFVEWILSKEAYSGK